MRIDLYTKTVLTVIAVCLVWIALGGPSVLTAVQAQGTAVQNVRIVGWGSSGGSSRELPLPVITKPD